ncbi:MAG: serine acetyltransferase [Kiritimatiellae bacterium]|nr:serine acetyltransferase [Kiritimatiellia bacterium]
MTSLFRLIASDIRCKAEWLYGSAGRRNLWKALLTDGTVAMILYRFMQASYKARLGLLAMVFNKLNVLLSRCVIGRGADFGPEFVLIHSLGVVINSSVRGGRRILVEHLVTIGAEKNEAPVLGDNVFIGAGAKILGGVKIGNNVKIGANAVVVDDIPDNCTAVGIPAKVVGERNQG